MLEGIGNTLEIYVKTSNVNKRGRYISHARICVYINDFGAVLGSINVSY